jgi:hypothetical protein
MAAEEQQLHVQDFCKKEMTNRQVLEKLIQYKFFLRRLEFGFPLEQDEIMEELCNRSSHQIIDLSVLVWHVSFPAEEVLWKLKWELWKRTGYEYEISDYRQEQQWIAIPISMNELLSNVRNLQSKETKTILSEDLGSLKGLYVIALNKDRERGSLHKDRNFHFSYYDAIAFGDHVKEFLQAYERWIMSQIDGNFCENTVGLVS